MQELQDLQEAKELDCAISEIDFNKRKVTLSIKLLEELEKKEALEKYGSEGSGKNLPFFHLRISEKKKRNKKQKIKLAIVKSKLFKTIIKKLS